MNIKLLPASLSIALLAGCASVTSHDNVYDYALVNNNKDSSEFSYLDSKYHTDEMKLMYVIGSPDTKPINANNLDKYGEGFNPHRVSDGSLTAGTGLALAGGMNFAQFGVFALTNATGRVSMVSDFTTTRLITLVPTNNLSRDELEHDFDYARDQMVIAVENAIKASGLTPVTNVWGAAYYIAGVDESGAVPKCNREDSLIDGNQAPSSLCSNMMITSWSSHRTNVSQTPYAPSTDFIVLSLNLTPGFPIQNIEMPSELTSYLYVPPWGEVNSRSVEVYDRDVEGWADLYQRGKLSMFPYLKDLSNGEINYFNRDLRQYQPDSKSVIL